MTNKLKTTDAETLMTLPLEPIQFIVEGLIPQGLHILAGSPKIGKSWLSLWICLQVAKGEAVWDFPTRQCEVLYLCLEDSLNRIQSRLFDLTEDAPPTLHFATFSKTIGDGLENQIDLFLADHPDTKLIFIDTLQKIRQGKSPSSNLYEADYEDIGAVKRIADKHKLALVLVHHLRKAKDNDPLNMISGSSGIAGATDSNLVLQKAHRTENSATLICAGRDIEGRELSLEFNREQFLWQLVDPIELEEKAVPSLILLLCDYVQSVVTFTGTATELATALNLSCGEEVSPSVLKKKLVQHMEFIRKRGISYSDNRTFRRREFTLCYDVNDAMTASDSPYDLPSLPS